MRIGSPRSRPILPGHHAAGRVVDAIDESGAWIPPAGLEVMQIAEIDAELICDFSQRSLRSARVTEQIHVVKISNLTAET
jgi:hypothetical protein